MSEVLLDMAMSLDGFTVDRKGESLYPVEDLRGTPELLEMINSTGAVVMDQEFYDQAHHDFSNYIYQVPIFVVTDNPTSFVTKGQNKKMKFTFVTDGILHAVKLARAAAKKKNVTIVGGVKVAQMALEAGVVDTLKVRLINVIVGKGIRLFDHLTDQRMKLETIYTKEHSHRTDLCFKIVRYKYFTDETVYGRSLNESPSFHPTQQ
jgi:dihydrofolate reductase